MMLCGVCGEASADVNRYCAHCGSSLGALPDSTLKAIKATVDQKVSESLKQYIQDQRIAEFQITENVTNRLISWGKTFCLVLGIVVTIGGYFGYQQIAKLSDMIDRAEYKLQPTLAKAETQANNLNKEMGIVKHDMQQIQTNKKAMVESLGDASQEVDRIIDEVDLQARTIYHLNTKARGLPQPTGTAPYHLSLKKVDRQAYQDSILTGKLIFQTVGDTGGVIDPRPQLSVSAGLQNEFHNSQAQRPSFLYILGNIVYYNGESYRYYSQFYYPYKNYNARIFAIAGNDDGQDTGSSVSLEGFIRNFCAPNAVYNPESHDTGRLAMTEPNIYWTLDTPLATIVGLYTNVPYEGIITSEQQTWLEKELQNAPTNKALIIALHHSPFSLDDQHSGSRPMGQAISEAINKSRRIPNMVLSAHVSNYQRIELNINGSTIPFLVIGTGGYRHLNLLTRINGVRIHLPMRMGPVTVKAGIDDKYGFVHIEVNKDFIEGSFEATTTDGPATPMDVFKYSARAQFLKPGQLANFN